MYDDDEQRVIDIKKNGIARSQPGAKASNAYTTALFPVYYGMSIVSVYINALTTEIDTNLQSPSYPIVDVENHADIMHRDYMSVSCNYCIH